MEVFYNYLETNVGIPTEISANIFSTILLFVIIFLSKAVIDKVIEKNVKTIKLKYNIEKGINYLLYGISFIVLIRIWFNGFQGFSTFLGLFSAGLAIALKDLIVNIAGWIFILWRSPFSIGDRIEIDDHKGDVVDIRIFNFTIMEIGNWVDADQHSGRLLHVPNKFIFDKTLSNYDIGFSFIFQENKVLITFESDWKKAKEILLNILKLHFKEFYENTSDQFKISAKKYFIDNSNFKPDVFTTVLDSGVLLTMRYYCNPRDRRKMDMKIWESILNEFEKHEDIELAYPTYRIYKK
jgi:small-conductance mechanosensitive channel